MIQGSGWVVASAVRLDGRKAEAIVDETVSDASTLWAKGYRPIGGCDQFTLPDTGRVVAVRLFAMKE